LEMYSEDWWAWFIIVMAVLLFVPFAFDNQIDRIMHWIFPVRRSGPEDDNSDNTHRQFHDYM
jgi:hypothetical protein